MIKKVHILLCILLLGLPAPVLAADQVHEVSIGNDKRQFQVHVPVSTEGKKGLPVVLVFHGGGGDAEGVRFQTGMDAVADKNGFIAVYPEGTPSLLMSRMRTWNAGTCCGRAAKKKADDVAFVSKIIDFLTDSYGVDARRIYATGHSNGAQFSYRLACELADKIAAVAPNAGQRQLDSCHPARPIAVLHIHGTADPCSKFDGGECGGCYSKLLGNSFHLPGDLRACRPVRDIVAEHAKMNGCGDATDIVFTRGAVTCEAFTGCPKSAPVELCSIAGAGHMWAGANDRGGKSCSRNPDKRICKRYREIVGPQNDDIDAGEFMWQFFKDIRLPEAPAAGDKRCDEAAAKAAAAADADIAAFCADKQYHGCDFKAHPPQDGSGAKWRVTASLIHSFDEKGAPRFMPEGFTFADVSAECGVTRVFNMAGEKKR